MEMDVDIAVRKKTTDDDWVEIDLQEPPKPTIDIFQPNMNSWKTSDDNNVPIWIASETVDGNGGWLWLSEDCKLVIQQQQKDSSSSSSLWLFTYINMAKDYGWFHLKSQLWKNKWDVVLYGINIPILIDPTSKIYHGIRLVCYAHKFLIT